MYAVRVCVQCLCDGRGVCSAFVMVGCMVGVCAMVCSAFVMVGVCAVPL